MFTLRGNDFTLDEIQQWYQEEEAHFDQCEGSRSLDQPIVYERFNLYYALDHFILPHLSSEKKLLCFGCAEGREISRIAVRQNFQLYRIEASSTLLKGDYVLFDTTSFRKE